MPELVLHFDKALHASIVLVGSHAILVCGGSETGSGKGCESYDIAGDKWSPFPDMNVDRYIFGLVEFQGSVYAIGGGDGDSIERFDEKSNRWQLLDYKLKEKRWDFAAVLW